MRCGSGSSAMTYVDMGGSLIKRPSPLSVLKDTYDPNCNVILI
jgi:hypothetical protein